MFVEHTKSIHCVRNGAGVQGVEVQMKALWLAERVSAARGKSAWVGIVVFCELFHDLFCVTVNRWLALGALTMTYK